MSNIPVIVIASDRAHYLYRSFSPCLHMTSSLTKSSKVIIIIIIYTFV